MAAKVTRPTIHTRQNGAVVARLTVARANGMRTIVEVRSDATFHDFYCFYRQLGGRRSTKTLLRVACRNEGLPVVNSHLYSAGLDVIASRLEMVAAVSNPVTKKTLRVIRRKQYQRLIGASPASLGMTSTRTVVHFPVRIAVPFSVAQGAMS